MTELKEHILNQILAGRSQSEIANSLTEWCERNGDLPLKEAHDELITLWQKRQGAEITEEAIENGEIKLKQYNSVPPRYELYWEDIGGTIPVNLSNMDELWSWATVNKRMAERWRVVCADLKPREWHELLGKLISKAKVIERPGASDAAAVLDILDNWFQRESTDRWSKVEIYNRPLYKEGFYYFRVEVFEKNALFKDNSRFFYQRWLMDRPKLWQILSDAGAVSKVENFRGKKVRVWKIAENFNEPNEPATEELEEEYEPLPNF